MIAVENRGNIDKAIQFLAEKRAVAEIDKQLKLAAIPKKSERAKFKRFLSLRRRARNEARKVRREGVQ